MLGAAEEFENESKKNKDKPYYLEKAFANNFNPTRDLHKIVNKLGLNLDVKSGEWISKK